MTSGWWVAALFAGLVGCNARSGAHESEPDDAPMRRLVGSWQVTFQADPHETPGLRDSSANVSGMIAFTRNRYGPRSDARVGALTHEGVYDLDFRPFGFSTRDAGEPASAVARVFPATGHDSASDSLIVILSPGAARFAVQMSGTVVGDSATGRWLASSFSAGGGAGGFRMRRTAAAP
jgi:hypothetical protein